MAGRMRRLAVATALVVVAGVGVGVAPGKVSTAAHLTGALTVNAWNQGELYAFHTGVCNVVMGDGSVKSVKSSIDMSTLQRLAARSDGNPVSVEN